LLPEGHCAVVSQDNYYRPRHEQERDVAGHPNFDLPGAIRADRLFSDLQRLLAGETIAKTEYTFNQPNRPGKLIVVEPAPVILLEGLFLFHFAEIRSLFDMRIFIDAPEDVCKQRRLQRDADQRGYDAVHVEYQWDNHVRPAFQNFVLPYRDQAHVIITNHDNYDTGLQVIAEFLRNAVR